MKNLEKYIGLAKNAKDYAIETDNIVRFPNVAKAHINGLSDMVLKLIVEIKSLEDSKANIAELEAEIARLKAIIEDMKVIDNVFWKGELPYGSCPVCHGAGLSRERRPNGNDKCVNGHVYPSREAMKATNDN